MNQMHLVPNTDLDKKQITSATVDFLFLNLRDWEQLVLFSWADMFKVENYPSLGRDQSAARNSRIANMKQVCTLCVQIFRAKKMKGILRQNVLGTQVRKAES